MERVKTSRPELNMTLPRTVADVLTDHVVLEVECIDRLYLNVYQPRLQYPAGAAAFLVGHRLSPGLRILVFTASTVFRSEWGGGVGSVTSRAGE